LCLDCRDDYHMEQISKAEIKEDLGCPPDQVYCGPFDCNVCKDRYLSRKDKRKCQDEKE
jgi:hypothetical protein